MTAGGTDSPALILVLDDVEEVRDATAELLASDGYRVVSARDEREAVARATRERPDLILVSLGAAPPDVIDAAARVRQASGLPEGVPVVVFCDDMIPEGTEKELQKNLYICRPDNFNQLRALIKRVLSSASTP
jgi:CheY-like chemotaxis protein